MSEVGTGDDIPPWSEEEKQRLRDALKKAFQQEEPNASIESTYSLPSGLSKEEIQQNTISTGDVILPWPPEKILELTTVLETLSGVKSSEYNQEQIDAINVLLREIKNSEKEFHDS